MTMDRDKRTMALHCGECTEADSAARAAAQRTLAPRRSHKPRSKRGAVVKRKAKKVFKSAMRRSVRATVLARSLGRCEFIDPDSNDRSRCSGHADIWDHFWGRGKDESVEGSWMLCATHNDLKTEWVGGRYRWVMSFYLHAASHHNQQTPGDYLAQVNKSWVVAQHEAAQHPNRTETA